MPFIPHTEADTRHMLAAIGVDSIADLFDEVPSALPAPSLSGLAEGVSERQMLKQLQRAADQDAGYACYIGAGAYEHHIPAAVWDIASRGEFMTAYTPYQAEASQGTLQLLYEFQTMMTELTAMDVANASLYDGASALAEAVLMAIRANRKRTSRVVIMPDSVHPLYRQTVAAICRHQQVQLRELPLDSAQLTSDLQQLDRLADAEPVAVVIPQPNFFGSLEAVDQLTDWAHSQQALVIGLVNPLALALLKPPGEWGERGADIAVGEGQPFGLPLASGGPYFGFMCCRQAIVRQMPGRIIGKTVDSEGRTGYALTLQAREQHIRRSKATSNICTNQGLAVTAASIHMSLLGAEGLLSVARQCYANAHELAKRLAALPGFQVMNAGPRFHEFVLACPVPAELLIEQMAKQQVLPGLALSTYYPDMANQMLVCVTETKDDADLKHYVDALKQAQEALV